MTFLKGCRHRPRCKAGTAGAMVRHHPSKELPKEVYEYGRKVMQIAASLRGADSRTK